MNNSQHVSYITFSAKKFVSCVYGGKQTSCIQINDLKIHLKCALVRFLNPNTYCKHSAPNIFHNISTNTNCVCSKNKTVKKLNVYVFHHLIPLWENFSVIYFLSNVFLVGCNKVPQ